MVDVNIQQLDKMLLDKLKFIGEEVAAYRCRSYLVGGIVRDLIWGRRNRDLDLVVEENVMHLPRH